MKFEDLGLAEPLVRAVRAQGYRTATPIQVKAIPGVLEGRDLMPSARSIAEDIEKSVDDGGGVDGVTHRREATVDGLEISHSVRMLENIRRQTAQSPLQKAPPLRVGVLGYGEDGRAATANRGGDRGK